MVFRKQLDRIGHLHSLDLSELFIGILMTPGQESLSLQSTTMEDGSHYNIDLEDCTLILPFLQNQMEQWWL